MTCCVMGGGGGGGCTPEYAAPSLGLENAVYEPPYPLVVGQDPDKVGFTVTLSAQGGKKTNNCEGPDRAKISRFGVVEIDLTERSRDWITDELGLWYPGAYVKGDYPDAPDWEHVSGLGTPNATLSFHYSPKDPGYYAILIQVIQDRGKHKNASGTLKVPVYLLETTIVR